MPDAVVIRDPEGLLTEMELRSVRAWVDSEPRPAGVVVRMGWEIVAGHARPLMAIAWEPGGVPFWCWTEVCPVVDLPPVRRRIRVHLTLGSIWGRFRNYLAETGRGGLPDA